MSRTGYRWSHIIKWQLSAVKAGPVLQQHTHTILVRGGKCHAAISFTVLCKLMLSLIGVCVYRLLILLRAAQVEFLFAILLHYRVFQAGGVGETKVKSTGTLSPEVFWKSTPTAQDTRSIETGVQAPHTWLFRQMISAHPPLHHRDTHTQRDTYFFSGVMKEAEKQRGENGFKNNWR